MKEKQVRSSLPMLTGKVISDKMDKTISVLTVRRIKHKKYEKYIQKKSVFKAHDEKNEARNGDFVLIYGTRPLSKTKRWMLKKILEKSKSDLFLLPKEVASFEKESSELFLKKKNLKEESQKSLKSSEQKNESSEQKNESSEQKSESSEQKSDLLAKGDIERSQESKGIKEVTGREEKGKSIQKELEKKEELKKDKT